jgi:hypothetical protein
MANYSGQDNGGDGKFYKGLFYGLLLGVGLVWFLGTKEGKKLKEQLSDKGEDFIEKTKETIDKSLSEDFVEGDQGPSEGSTKETDSPPNRLFEEK